MSSTALAGLVLMLPGPGGYAQTVVDNGTLVVSSDAQLGGDSVIVDNASNRDATLAINAGVSIDNEIIVDNQGTLANAGTLSRMAPGDMAVRSDQGGATVNNAGTGRIEAESIGVALADGGTVNNNGGTITATTDAASKGVYVYGRAGIVNNLAGGIIEAKDIAVQLNAGGTVTNDSGSITANWGAYISGEAGVVHNLAGGSIRGEQFGALLDAGGAVSNAGAASTIGASAVDGIGVFVNGDGSVTNQGSISGGLGGVRIWGAGTMTNTGGTIRVTTDDQGHGVEIVAGLGTVTNQGGGTIAGKLYGVSLADGGTVANTASTIIADGTDPIAAGVGISGGLGTVTNTGAGSLIKGPGAGVRLIDGGTVVNGAGATIQGAASVQVIAGNTTLSNAGALVGHVLLHSASTNTVTLFTGSSITGDLLIGANAASTLTLDGSGSQLYSTAVSGVTSFSAGALIKQGSGTWMLDKAMTGIGATTVAGGTLRAGAAGAFAPTSAFTVASGAVLDLAGFNQGIGSLAGAGMVALGAGTLTTGADGSSTGFSGAITGTGGLTKAGAGSFTLSGANAYTGATNVAGGTLRAGAAGSFAAASAFAVASGAALDLAGFNQGIGSLAGAGAVALGAGTLTTGADGSSTGFSGAITGSGGLTKAGAGAFTLSGANSYTGVTNVAGGTLRAGAVGSFATASAFTVASGAVLDLAGFNQGIGSLAGAGAVTLGAGTLTTGADGSSTGFSGAITGSGGLTKAGAGSFTLSGASSYTGATNVAGGTLRAGAAGSFAPTSAFTVASGAALDLAGFNQGIGSLAGAGAVALGSGTLTTGADGSSTVFSGAITGSGGLTKAGAGTFTLSGASSYTGVTNVAGGTLRAGATGAFSTASAFTVASGATLDLAGFSQSLISLAGAGTVALGAGTLTTGADGSSTTFSGAIGGTGGLTKVGAGIFTLSGASSYSGATNLAAGRLVVNGSIANSVVTVAGGTLAGTGTVGGIVAGSGATIAPGNSIGTLSVTGNVAFAAGSIYQLEINAAGQGDKIAATGLATLSGGTVQVLAEAGNYAAATRYTILTANGGVSGQFAGVSSNFAFLSPTLSYGAQDVMLTMVRNDFSFGPDGSGRPYIAQTRNQGFIANAAERLGVGNPVYDTLVSATVAEARAGFDALSGEAHAQGVAVAIGESRLVREAVLGRLRGSLLTPPGEPVAAGFTADLPGAKGAVMMPAPRPDERFALWGEAIGGQADSDGDGNAASLSRRTGGAILGADLKLYDTGASSLRVGIAGGYTRSNFDVDGRLSSGKLESGHALLYAGARQGNWRLDGGVGYSFGETSLTRQVLIRGFGDTLRSQRDTDLLQAFVELGYAFRFQGFALEPFAQVALLRVSSGSATEQGGAAALRVSAQDQSLGFTTLGLRAEAQIGAMPLFARGLLGWRYGFGDLTPQAGTGFAGAGFVAGIPARVYAAQIDRNALVAEAGLDWRVGKATTLGLAYSAAIGERTRDHALKGRLEVRF